MALLFGWCCTCWAGVAAIIPTPQQPTGKVNSSGLTSFPNNLVAPGIDKVTSDVIQKAQQGIGQELFVQFEHKDILASEAKKRGLKGIHVNDNEIEFATRQGFQAVKDAVFPGDKFGNAYVMHFSNVVPMAKIFVPDYATLQSLLANPKVERIYPEATYQRHGISTQMAASLAIINQPALKSAGKTGAGTTVAVLDDDIAPYNEVFSTDGSSGCKWSWQTGINAPIVGSSGCKISYFQDFTGTQSSSSYTGGNIGSHGSNVAGIVLSTAPDTRIAFLQTMYRILTNGEASSTSFTMAANAMEWVIANARSRNIVAMNMSFGGGLYSDICPTSRYWTYFNRARMNNVIPIVSTGNDGNPNSVQEPSCSPNAVSVGNVYNSNQASAQCSGDTPSADRVVCTSNSFPSLTLLAPGATVCAGGGCWAGTSQAAPQVAGGVAILRASNAYSSESIDTTVSRLKIGGTPITDWRQKRTTPRLNMIGAFNVNPQNVMSATTVQSIINILLMGGE